MIFKRQYENYKIPSKRWRKGLAFVILRSAVPVFLTSNYKTSFTKLKPTTEYCRIFRHFQDLFKTTMLCFERYNTKAFTL